MQGAGFSPDRLSGVQRRARAPPPSLRPPRGRAVTHGLLPRRRRRKVRSGVRGNPALQPQQPLRAVLGAPATERRPPCGPDLRSHAGKPDGSRGSREEGPQATVPEATGWVSAGERVNVLR